MDAVHKEVLDIHHSRLVTSLRANDVIDRLLKEEAINKYDYDQLKRTEAQGPRAMNRLLLLTLRRRGGEAFPALQRSLEDTGQKDLHEALRTCELDLLEGLVADRLQWAAGGVGGPSSSSTSQRLPAGLELGNLHNSLDLDLDLDPDPDPDLHADTDTRHHRHRRSSPAQDSNRSESSPVPVLQKASSPALKTSTSPGPRRQTRRPRAKEGGGGGGDGGGGGSSSPPPPSSPLSKEQERERQLKELEKEVRDLRTSYGKMETELKQQIEQLEKGKEKGEGEGEGKEGGGKKKKDGGCAVM
ncbi:uncharacterized protein LOC143296105 isoform X2 [Babylonia areolata]